MFSRVSLILFTGGGATDGALPPSIGQTSNILAPLDTYPPGTGHASPHSNHQPLDRILHFLTGQTSLVTPRPSPWVLLVFHICICTWSKGVISTTRNWCNIYLELIVTKEKLPKKFFDFGNPWCTKCFFLKSFLMSFKWRAQGNIWLYITTRTDSARVERI